MTKKNVIIANMIKRFVLTLFLILGFTLMSNAEELVDNVQLPVRDYDGIELPIGTFIPVLNTQDISTQYCPQGYKVKFIATNDLYLHDTNIIPKDTEFYGYIEEIHEPVVGTHSSMKIKITKVVFADGFEFPIKAYIYTTNGNLIGGGLTNPAKYVKMPHYQQAFQGRFWSHRGPTLQIRPGTHRLMGEHTRINAGESLLIIIVAPAYITHTLTN